MERTQGPIVGKGFSYPYSCILFIDKKKENCQTGLPRFDPMTNPKRVSYAQAILGFLLKQNCPWICSVKNESELNDNAKIGKLRMSTVENILKYQVIAMTENGKPVFMR